MSALIALASNTPAHAAPQPLLHREFVVVIDPGHGGTNDGCLAHDGSVHEKQLTLQLAQGLQAQLHTIMPHAEVRLTHEADVTMTLADRVAFANAAGADLFLSIHANASPGHDQTGHETYVLELEASSLEAARTAQRENDEGFSRPSAVDEVDFMLRQLTLTSNRARAVRFAALLQREYGTRFPERDDRGVRQAPFDVLMGVRMPAVLTEVGFLDHPEEGPVLLDGQTQSDLVESMADAVFAYYRTVERQQ